MDRIVLETSPGRILKKIRGKFNIEKSDILDCGVSSDLIDLIENSKTQLSMDNARLICKNINNILEERNIDIIIEPEDLLNPFQYYAKEKVEVYITEFKKHEDYKDYVIDPDDLDELEFFLNEYDLMDKKIKVYEIIGDIYFNSRDYEKEYEYMSKAWELRTRYPKRKLNYRIMIKLANNCIDRGKYEDAIILYQNGLLNVEDIPEKYLSHLYYNYALAYSRLKMYSLALEIIADALRYSERKDYDLWRKSLLLEGICYFGMGEYELSLVSYNKALQVLSFTGYSDLKYLIYGNIAEAYLKLKDVNRIYKYLNIILEKIDELNKNGDYYCKICNKVAIIYDELEDFGKAEKYYKESLEYAKKNVQQNYITRNIISLTELNKKIKVRDIAKTIEQYNDDLISGIKVNDSLLAVLKSLKTYVDNKEYDRFEKLIDTIIEYQGGEVDEKNKEVDKCSCIISSII